MTQNTLPKKAEECATADEFIACHVEWRTSQGVETSEQLIECLRVSWQDSINAAKRRKGIYVPGSRSNYGNNHGRYLY